MAGPITVMIPMPHTEVKYKQTNTTEQRAELMSVSASFSVSPMGGTIKLDGFGDYLSRQDSKEESTSISGAVRIRTRPHRSRHSDQVGAEFSRAAADWRNPRRNGHHLRRQHRRPHAREYREQKTNEHIKGEFSISTYQKLAVALGASGDLKLEKNEARDLQSRKIEVSLQADYMRSQAPTATDTKTLIERLQTAGRGFVLETQDRGEEFRYGVPLETTTPPIANFNSISTEVSFRELEEVEVKRIMERYDSIVTLMQRRVTLATETDMLPYKEFFPSFCERCHTKFRDVDRLLDDTRGKLGRLLHEYRLATGNTDSGIIEAFLETFFVSFNVERDAFRADSATWQVLLQTQLVSEIHGLPLTTVAGVSAVVGLGDFVVLVIAESVSKVDLLNAYRAYGARLKDWRNQTQGKTAGDGAVKTKWVSYYPDVAKDEVFIRNDATADALPFVLKESRTRRTPAFVMYAFLPTSKWRAVNHDGWGTLFDRGRTRVYVEGMRNGLPHGAGVMSYVDKTCHTGNWLFGLREGSWQLCRGTAIQQDFRILNDSLYYANFPVPRTWPCQGEVAFTSEPLPKPGGLVGDMVWGLSSAVQMVVEVYHGPNRFASSTFSVLPNSPAQTVAKIAGAFGWREGERHLLSPTPSNPWTAVDPKSSIIANGSAIETLVTPWPDVDAVNDGRVQKLSLFEERAWLTENIMVPGGYEDQGDASRSGRVKRCAPGGIAACQRQPTRRLRQPHSIATYLQRGDGSCQEGATFADGKLLLEACVRLRGVQAVPVPNPQISGSERPPRPIKHRLP